MATTDFTLEDIERLLDQRFMQEREYTRRIVREEVNDQFMNFIEHTFQPAVDSLQTQISETRQDMAAHRAVTDQHSIDIMELRAHTA